MTMAQISDRLQEMKRRQRAGEHRALRQSSSPELLAEFDAAGLTWTQRAARLTRRMCEAEQVVIGADECIVFTRTLPSVPPIYSPEQWAELTVGRTLHELGPISNICADWRGVLADGLLARRAQAEATRAAQPDCAEFLDAAIETIDAVLALAGRYAAAARELGRDDIAEVLDRVPAEPPQTFRQALQALRLLHAVVWLSGHYHVGLGRLDQYLWPYLEADLDAGRLDWAEADELLAEFFITLNRDSDLYPGVQQGDNGQSLMLGGLTPAGTDGVNPLTHAVLRVSQATALIDPKINLRVTSDTDLGLLTEAAKLTRLGLGFPQYSNDDVVIPGLLAHGYELADARDYSVAACWEFIIPGRGMEVVNAGAVSLPAAADRAIRVGLAAGDSFEGILTRCEQDIADQLGAVVEAYRRLLLPPAPYYSVLMDGPLATGRDLADGLRYNNFGVHGACAASAADALAAVRQVVYTTGEVSPSELLAALDADYEGHEALRERLRDVAKVGNHDDATDDLLVRLLAMFAEACEAVGDNGRGGLVRPGTGSAMYYVWLARGHQGMREPVVGATADGRHAGEFFGANLAPTPGATVRGPLSVLQSFGKLPYERVCNGGPITLELSDTAFRNEEALGKVAMLVRAFAQTGGQQLQLNTLDLATLEDAQRHPDQHRNLNVRVWGWSGYFCELDEVYQQHIMARHRHGF